MPTKPVSRGKFFRTLFTSVGAAVAGGFAGLKLVGRSGAQDLQSKAKITVVSAPRTIARSDLA
jgi:hypothetical protein